MERPENNRANSTYSHHLHPRLPDEDNFGCVCRLEFVKRASGGLLFIPMEKSEGHLGASGESMRGAQGLK